MGVVWNVKLPGSSGR